MNIFKTKTRKNKIKNTIVIGRKGTGMVRQFIKPIIQVAGEDLENVGPFTDVTGEQLLNALYIRGERAVGCDDEFTDEEIYIALVKCKQLLNAGRTRFIGKEKFDITISERQDFCSNATIQLVMQNRYNQALHEFEDCIDDYGKGQSRTITINEYVLYNCMLNCFIARLEEYNPELSHIVFPAR